MAIKHKLSLELIDTTNEAILRIFDTSVYADGLTISCGNLKITPPGFNIPKLITVDPKFNAVITACDLGLQTSQCDDIQEVIPDGVYVINYSVSPAVNVFVEYNHLRVTQTLNKYYTYLSEMDLGPCSPSGAQEEILTELRLIKSFIDAAKVKVEYNHDVTAGINLLAYAQKRLSKLTEGSCN